MTLAVLASRALCGMHAHAVRVETHLGAGLPSFNVVGLADTEVRESRERVRAAIINSGFEFPAGRITVNLSPADIPKESGRFDLPIALGLLLASGQLTASADGVAGQAAPDPALVQLVLAGELSLTGALVPVAAPLVIALGVARDAPDATLILPAGSAEQAAWVPGLRVLSARSLADVAAHAAGVCLLPNAVPRPWPEAAPVPCLSDVRGQPGARRALEVAAAGGHSLLMVGPPGAGKSMLAARLPGLLPPLERSQALEAAAVAAMAGVPDGLMGQPPFRAPHHSASVAALVGGGGRPRPGEISLAHHGVLFLDEFPEFSRRTLEALREPLEAGRVVISRALQTVQFPARFQLVAAMNPCPCGWRGHPARACGCTPDQVARYVGKVSGPLLDRIDLHVALPPSDPECMNGPPGEASEPVRARVMRCRERQQARQGKPNAGLAGAELDRFCVMDGDARSLLLQAMRRLAGSARAMHRALRVARTIADLDGEDVLAARHVAQAVQYRRPGV
ncbi:YifB family Mg chelatase-like AAA ATPase [Achromobacter deleyi]|uniref:YifB family Mg chelatase-like AAA ATPase n=1 Tax=Achromobacter deleyi TaxID=1353891 RepID=UPI001491F12E|nr:YifB family Mg chelatase-like AAA ATPase [Achromobacter deleyi]QVQ29080.1 YifB family Mg chelatase-like AAA ATPase [Achromobacter deleyi]UIP19200.1 YifB family Mg chelatase-like AAA ATPase [Achromobacter deleyi]